MRVFYINSRLLTNFYIIINLKFLLNLIYLFKVNETIQFNSSLFHEVSICAFFFFFQYGLRLWKKMDFFIFPDFGQEGLFGFYKLKRANLNFETLRSRIKMTPNSGV